MHVSLPFAAIARRARGVYYYFKTGVAVEGDAWLCSSGHPMVIFADQPWPAAPQHVDVEIRFWNRRGERISVIELVSARIPTYNVELTEYVGDGFEALALEPGDPPQESSFRLVPKHDPKARVEASAGSWLELEFRPSRGDERRARPKFRCQLGVRDPR